MIASRREGDVLDEASREPVAGTFSMLDRADGGVTTKLRTRGPVRATPTSSGT
jgi:hypothetical protein